MEDTVTIIVFMVFVFSIPAFIALLVMGKRKIGSIFAGSEIAIIHIILAIVHKNVVPLIFTGIGIIWVLVEIFAREDWRYR
ncbi:MAG: hypothetical protein J6A96_01010 [Clostridia bacterium]|nr:hypothetical protein [Clostridia bacterium]